MRRLSILLATAAVLLLGTARAQAPTEPAPETTAIAAVQSDEPGFLSRGGAVDQLFGEMLELAAFVPFYDLLGTSPPAFPWYDADGEEIDAAGYQAFQADYLKIVEGKLPDRMPRPWRTADDEQIVIGVTGQVQLPRLPFVVIWLVIGALFFTLTWRFVNLRMFRHALQVVRGRFDSPDCSGEVSHFQALASALSATVGLGNIAGVAIAISLGGPGATFWMVLAGLLGMSLKFTECTLGQKYRKIDAHGRVSGGPMHYLPDGLAELGLRPLGVLLGLAFTVFCIGGSLAGGNAFQVNQSLGILSQQVPWFAEHSWVYGVIMAVLVGVVIIGGIQRIASTAGKIVPAMCGIYVLACLVVIIGHAADIPDALTSIFRGAFASEAVYGGFIGALITGFQRAAFSNEAGVGSAAIAHSAARTEYPVREGIVALLEPFIDTVVVCTMTALVIVISGVFDPSGQHADLVAGKEGAALTQAAFQGVDFLHMSSWFPYLLLVAVVMFAFSTMISWSYYGERCWCRLFGQRSSIVYKALFLLFVVLGSVVSAVNVLEFGDLMILIMAFPNILGLYFLRGVVRRELVEYEQKLKAGELEVCE